MSEKWFPAPKEPTVLGRFRYERVLDIPKSKELDEHVYKDVIVLETKVNGQIDTTVQVLKPHNRNEMLTRFPEAWRSFEGEEFVFDPKALDGLGLSEDQIAHLSIEGIRTKEQIAGLTDAQCQSMGFGWRKLRDTAIKQVQEAKDAKFEAAFNQQPQPVKRGRGRPRKQPEQSLQ